MPNVPLQWDFYSKTDFYLCIKTNSARIAAGDVGIEIVSDACPE